MKRILIETGHPAQVHQFRHLAKELTERGHQVLFATRDKPLCTYLLDTYGLTWRMLGKSRKGILAKLLSVPAAYVRFFSVIRSFRPDIILSRFTPESSHLAWLMHIPHIGFTDSEHVRWMDTITVPFVRVKITAHSYTKDLGNNHFRFPGNIELFYLHPSRYRPDPSVLNLLGIRTGEPYALVRFVSWSAYHDVKQQGLTLQEKTELVELLSSRMKVFVSAEGKLPPSLEAHRLDIPPNRIHDVLAYAQLYVGEGATMASESAILGTPAVYVNSLTAGSIEDAARAGLIYSFRSGEGVADKILELLDDPDCADRHRQRCEAYLKGMVDVTSFITWLIDAWPGSLTVLRENPLSVLRFRKEAGVGEPEIV